MTNSEIWRKAWKLWGADAQLDMISEECTEIIKAVNKLKRKKKTKYSLCVDELKHLTEEIADVFIVIAQYVFVMDQTEYLSDVHAEKMENLRLKIMNEKIKRCGKNKYIKSKGANEC